MTCRNISRTLSSSARLYSDDDGGIIVALSMGSFVKPNETLFAGA